MAYEEQIRNCAHQLIDRMDAVRLAALLDLLDEDFFTPEEIAEIKELERSGEWTDWRSIRNDV
jgi:hypothetical protein